MSVASAIRRMMDAGLTVEQALIAAEACEAELLPTRSKAAARTARWRENKASQSVTERHSDGRDAGDVSLTPSPTPPTPNPSPKENPPKGGQKKGSRIPADYRPDVDAATAEGLPRHVAEREARKFVDYYLAAPGQKGVKLDWPATWRNWFRSTGERLGIELRPASTGPPQSTEMVCRSDPRWEFLAARYERETGRSLKLADKWPFPEQWLEKQQENVA